VPTASQLQLLKSGTLSLQLFVCVCALMLYEDPLFPAGFPIAFLLAPQIWLFLIIVSVYKLCLLTYLLTANEILACDFLTDEKKLE